MKDMWNTSPVIAVVIFGLPFLVVVFLISMLCCFDVGDDDKYHPDFVDNSEQRGMKCDEKGNIVPEPVSKTNRPKKD